MEKTTDGAPLAFEMGHNGGEVIGRCLAGAQGTLRKVSLNQTSCRICKKLPCGPSSRIVPLWDIYSMEIADDRFERCVMETPNKMSVSPPMSPEWISRVVPLRSAMLEICA